MNLRPREADKELGPPTFRYRAGNYLEKISDTLRYRNPVTLASTKEIFAQNLLTKQGLISNNLRTIAPNDRKDHRKRENNSGLLDNDDSEEDKTD